MFAKLLFPFRLFWPNKDALLAFILGASAILAQAPLLISIFMLVALVGLFWLWSRAKETKHFIQLGLWFGLGYFGVGVSWLISSMYVFSDMSLPLSLLATFSFVVFLSIYFALAGWVVAWLYRPEKLGLTFGLMVPVVWVFFELIRGTWFTGFPFLLVGSTHLDTWLDGYAPVLGTFGMSYMLALTAGLLVWMLLARNWVLPSLIILTVWLTGASLQSVEWVEKSGKTVDVALVQGNIAQETKWQRGSFLPTLRTYIGLTNQNMDADVIVWPETAVPAYFDLVEKGVLKSFIKDAQLLNKDILIGVITRNQKTGEYYNALVDIKDPSQVYEKHHLVPFSEFFPFARFFKALSLLFNIPFSAFSQGVEMPEPMILAGQKVGVSICYEMAFGAELTRNIKDSKYLITVSNDAWFAHTLEPFQQRHDIQMRALELGREIARSTNTGFTMVADITGQVKAEMPAYTAGVLRAEVQPYVGETPFVRWQNKPVWLWAWLVLLGLLGLKAWPWLKLRRTKPKKAD